MKIKENQVCEWTWIDLESINESAISMDWDAEMFWDAEILDVPRGHSDAGYTASKWVPWASKGGRHKLRLQQTLLAPGSVTRKQSDGSRRGVYGCSKGDESRDKSSIFETMITDRSAASAEATTGASTEEAPPPIEIFYSGPLFQWTYCGICTSSNGEMSNKACSSTPQDSPENEPWIPYESRKTQSPWFLSLCLRVLRG